MLKVVVFSLSFRHAINSRFPNGVAVASDASMKDWMGYVYQQKPLPTNFTGVEVTLSVVDANGNYRTIGTATTDVTGALLTLLGTRHHWRLPQSSQHSQALTATSHQAQTQASQLTQQQQQQHQQQHQQQSAADLYFIPAIAGLFVAIIVVGLTDHRDPQKTRIKTKNK